MEHTPGFTGTDAFPPRLMIRPLLWNKRFWPRLPGKPPVQQMPDHRVHQLNYGTIPAGDLSHGTTLVVEQLILRFGQTGQHQLNFTTACRQW